MSDFIFSKHALERLKQRSISQDIAEVALRNPDKTFPGKKPGTVKFIKYIQNRNVQLVGTYLADQKKWLVVSAWVRGEDDQVPLVWTLLTLPFKGAWWLIRKVFTSKTARKN